MSEKTCEHVNPQTRKVCGKPVEFCSKDKTSLFCARCAKLQPEPCKPTRLQSVDRHQVSVDLATADNRKHGRRGQVICSRMFSERVPGYLSVFPNFKQQNRQDGLGCAALSPKSLGPIVDMWPGLPPAMTIEARHQGTKCFDFEAIDGGQKPGPLFYKRRDELFTMRDPPRHKYGHTKDQHLAALKKMGAVYSRDNRPLYSVMPTEDGSGEVKLTYAESRWFYCTEYAALAPKTAQFQRLKRLLEEGTNLNIVGFDGHPLGNKTMDEWYADESKPFGHELVLVCLLTGQAPWETVGRPQGKEVY